MSAKILYFEGLRGIAAFIVFSGHFISNYFIAAFFIMGVLFPWQYFSVCIFFVLSGYVLTHAFFLHGDQEILVSSAVRRYIRLLIPILFLYIVIYVLLYPALGRINDLGAMLNLYSQIFWGVFFKGSTISGYTSVLWTITIEFIGSFIVFSFASLFGKLHNRWIFYCVALILFFNSFYLAFILGMALADFNKSELSNNLKIKNSYAILLFFIALLMGTFPSGNVDSDLYWGIPFVVTNIASFILSPQFSPFVVGGSLTASQFIYIIAAFFLLFALINSSWLQKILSSRIPVFLGKISYSLYIVHMTIIYTFGFFVYNIIFGQKITFLSGVVNFLLTSCVVISCSYLMYNYVDRPGVGFSKEVYELFFKKKIGPVKKLDLKQK